MIAITTLLKIKYERKQLVKSFLPKYLTAVCIDSRKANEHCFFVALKGDNHDSHNFIPDVIAKGCTVLIVSIQWFNLNATKYQTTAFIAVKDTTLALGQIAQQHRATLPVKIIAIGGSNGKTSTKELLYSVLSTQYNTLKTEGNLNNHIGVPLTLLRLTKQHEYAVLEVGCNHFDEITYLCNISDPNYGLITNIGKEHLEFFKNKAGVAKAELELFDYLRTKKNTICFVNYADTHLKNYADKKLSTKQKQLYACKTGFHGTLMGYTPHFNPMLALYQGNKLISTPIVNAFGKPALYNATAVACVAMHFNINLVNLNYALANFVSASSKRMDTATYGGITFVNDCYNSNPDSVILGLDSMRDYTTTGKKYLVIGDMLELGKTSATEHLAIGKYIAKLKLNNVYLFGAESTQTLKGCGVAVKNKKLYDNKINLAQDLLKLLQPNDIVYVKGSRGMLMEEVTNYCKTKLQAE
ncbi:MAG: UDP-N-acetylmuramoyl-tripeptide--D-alanyl-D-alanine ligase [Bacteroidia bacterium]|nr:UDP-N-acetylmuramoyl-tripeptide--D-alanyl-D-alanine ligase [Bacteroidia bacterium]